MNRTLRLLLPRIWLSRGAVARALLPLSWLYRAAAVGRRRCYQRGRCLVVHFARPVVVVGGITVGGSGKTPLTMHVARLLSERGWRPGIVSRGYGGRAPYRPLQVNEETSPGECGDEPAMMARRLKVPVVVDPERPRGVRCLIDELGCDVVVSDDGLQHYAMDRRVEIAVLGPQGLGNGWCLPAGPLREPASRLDDVDFIVRNGGEAGPGEVAMSLEIQAFKPLGGGAAETASAFQGRRLHAVAGTAHPERFFASLRSLGAELETHPFPDHHRYTAGDFAAMSGAPIVMTEKDAVKCRDIPLADAWYAEAAVTVDEGLDQRLIELLQP